MNGVHGIVSRRQAVQILGILGLSGPAGATLVAQDPEISPEVLQAAKALIDQDLSIDRLDVVAPALERNLYQFQIVRELEIDNLVEPAPRFVAGWR